MQGQKHTLIYMRNNPLTTKPLRLYWLMSRIIFFLHKNRSSVQTKGDLWGSTSKVQRFLLTPVETSLSCHFTSARFFQRATTTKGNSSEVKDYIGPKKATDYLSKTSLIIFWGQLASSHESYLNLESTLLFIHKKERLESEEKAFFYLIFYVTKKRRKIAPLPRCFNLLSLHWRMLWIYWNICKHCQP